MSLQYSSVRQHCQCPLCRAPTSRHPAKQAAAANASPPASAGRQATSRRQGKRHAARPPMSVHTPRRQRRPRQHQPTQACREQKPASKPQALASFQRNGKKRAASRFSIAPAGVSPPLPIAALFDLRSMQAARPEAKRRAGGRSGFAGGFRFFRHASRVSSKSHAPGTGQSAAKAVAVGCGCRPLRVVQLGANADCCVCSGVWRCGVLRC